MDQLIKTLAEDKEKSTQNILTQPHSVRGSDLLGLKVVTLEKGAFVEKVDDIIYDPLTNTVRALLVDPGGLFADAKVVMFDDIKSIGKDALLIDSEKVMKKVSQVPQPVKNIAKNSNYLTKTKIMSTEGEELGKVSDLIFEFPSGKVTDFEVSQGTLANLKSGKKHIKIEDIVTVGKDATIVKGYVDENFAKQSKKQGAQGAMMSVKKKAPKMMKQAEKKVKQWEKSATQKASQLTKQTKKEAEHLQEQAQKKTDEYQKKAQQMKNDPENQQKLEDAQKKTEETMKKAQQKFEDSISAAEQRLHDIQNDPKNQQRYEEAKGTVASTTQDLKKGVEETVQKSKEKITEERKKDALGKYVKINILSQKDKVIARRGDMITHKVLEQAEENDVLDQVVSNTSVQPVPTK